MAEKQLVERIAERLKNAYPQADRNNLCPAIYYDDFADIVDAVLDDIGASVDARTPPTHWIDNADSYLCSKCGYESSNPNNEKYGADVCPKCHSIMDKDARCLDMLNADNVMKLCSLIQDSRCPAWIWFPSNSEIHKFASYLVDNGVFVRK